MKKQISQAEFDIRVLELKKKENEENKELLLYLSFEDEYTWKGGIIVKACGMLHALDIINQLDINPGGQVVCIELRSDISVNQKDFNRLLNKRDVVRIFPKSN